MDPSTAKMDSNQKLELINLAIQKLIEEKGNKYGSGQSLLEDDDDHLLLSRLLSQLESLEGDDVHKQSEASTELEEVTSAAGEADTKSENAGQVDGGNAEVSTQEIVKELKKVKRQNAITHWLLSVMIVLTVAWQLSEVSLILNVKNRLNNPFKSFGSMFAGMLKGPEIKVQDSGKRTSSTERHSEAPILPVKMPELPLPELTHVELLDFRSNGEKH